MVEFPFCACAVQAMYAVVNATSQLTLAGTRDADLETLRLVTLGRTLDQDHVGTERCLEDLQLCTVEVEEESVLKEPIKQVSE